RGRGRRGGLLWRAPGGVARHAAGARALRERPGTAPMDRDERVICASADLADGEKGVRFTVRRALGEEPGFAIRHCGRVRGYVNRCPHAGTELDWEPGEFFDYSRL